MIKRKDLKKRAKHVFRKHYGFLFIICLFVAVLGTEFKNSTGFISAEAEVAEEEGLVTDTAITPLSATDVVNKALSEGIAAGKEEADEIKQQEVAGSLQAGASQILGRSRGVLAGAINSVSSGSIFITILSAINSISHSTNTAIVLFILGSVGIMIATWYFIKNTLGVILRRITLECRTYEAVPVSRVIFLIRAKRWCRVAWDMFVLTVFQYLWGITIVGGVIKHYSYRMVPFILAENPSLKARDAITLSRKMMNGHKWECFILGASFWGWDILGIITLGLTKVFFSNSYKICTYTEYYTELRKLSIENELEGVEAFNDAYLYEKAPKELLEKEYRDVRTLIEENKMPTQQRKGVFKFLADIFGIILINDAKEKEYLEYHEHQLKISSYKAYLEGQCYPVRLFTIPEKQKVKRAEAIPYLRCYSITSLIILFFTFAFIGWLWEVSLHLISDGSFVNRGVLHGPWLPIYGTGGVLILVVLNKLRKSPAAEFAAAIVLCGCVEYFTSYYLEAVHNGKKWWDYSGYFLNINGRICAEGLLVFGLGGMAIVYVAAPLMDNLICKIRLQIIIPICAVLLCVFIFDNVYSKKHPNAGKGITDYSQIQRQGYDNI